MQRMHPGFLFLVIMTLFGLVVSQGVEPSVKEYKNDIKEDGSYIFRYVLTDGTEREEAGYPEPDGTLFVSGYYTYVDPSGVKQYVMYYADKTGYHPKIGVPTPNVPFGLPAQLTASLLG